MKVTQAQAMTEALRAAVDAIADRDCWKWLDDGWWYLSPLGTDRLGDALYAAGIDEDSPAGQGLTRAAMDLAMQEINLGSH